MSNLKRAGIITFAAGATLSVLVAAGCSKKEEAAPSPQSGQEMRGGGPGMMGGRPGIGGAPGMMGVRMGGRGMMGRGGPVAADATGDQIYQQKCGCHGPKGAGGNGPKLAGIHDSEADLQKIVHDGKGRMPAFGSQLTDDQIKKVVTYVKGLSG